MTTFEDIQRKYNQLITSQNNTIDMIASYGVGITKDTPFQQHADKVKEAVSTKLAGILDGLTEFNLDERDFGKVTVIRRYAFYQNVMLKNLAIPEWITSIDPNAFYGYGGLATVSIPKNIRIQAGCFNGCTQLQKFYLPDVSNDDEVPTLVNVSAFTNTTCQFVVPNETSKELFVNASNWNTLADRFVVEEASV